MIDQPSSYSQSPSEEALIADLEMAYVKHKQSLLAIALNVTQCQALAEDAIQIAFSKLVQNSYQMSDLDAYVFKTVRNAAVDLVRGKNREAAKAESFFAEKRNLQDAENGHMANTHLNQIIRVEEQERIRKTIDALPAPDREIILLKIFSGFTFDQIANITESKSSTVATRYRRLLDKLRTKLKEPA